MRLEPASEIVKRFVSTAICRSVAVARSARDTRDRDEHDRRALQLRRRRRGPGHHMTTRRHAARQPREQVASARFGVTPRYLNAPTSWRSRSRRDRSREKAASCRHQGDEPHRAPAPAQPGMQLISPPPQSRHLLDRRLAQLSTTSDRQPPRANPASSCLGVGRRHQSLRASPRRRPTTSCHPPRRRHRRVTAVIDQERRRAMGAWSRRDSAGPVANRLPSA